MATQKLTDAKVRNLKPTPGKLRKVSDGGGLYLILTKAGSKLWRYEYRFDGKWKTFSIGAWPVVELEDARKARDEAKRLRAVGIDPSANKQAQKAMPSGRSVPSWSDTVDAFLTKKAQGGAAPTTMEKNRWLFNFSTDEFGNRPIDTLETRDFVQVLQSVEARGSCHSAGRLRSLCSSVFDYAEVCGYVSQNPVSCLKKGLLAVPRTKHRSAIVDKQQLGGLIRAIRCYQGDASTKIGLLLLAYIFLRPGELRYALWSDIDWKESRLRIPAERMKMNREHIVPLSRQALSLLRAAKALNGREQFILASRQRKGRPISENTFNAALRTMGYSKDQASAHGFRTTASTLLNEAGYPSDWIERQLAHVERNKVRGAYNRAEYLDGRVEMMQTWADTLDDLAGSPTPNDSMDLLIQG